jgi:hypothetical protein
MQNHTVVDNSQVPDTPTPAPNTRAQAKKIVPPAASMSSEESSQNQPQDDDRQIQPLSVPAVRTRSKTVTSGVLLPAVNLEKWGPPSRRKRSKKTMPDSTAKGTADPRGGSISQGTQNPKRYSNLSFLASLARARLRVASV